MDFYLGWMPVLPTALGRTLVKQLHEGTHLGIKKLKALLAPRYHIPHLHQLVQDVVIRCQACQATNATSQLMTSPGK